MVTPKQSLYFEGGNAEVSRGSVVHFEAGNNASGRSISKVSVRVLDADLAAQILIHHRYIDWLKIEDKPVRQPEGARRRAGFLMIKINASKFR